MVWIASDFREPHLAAIHWLNEHTLDPFAFFAVELRAVPIGTSPVDPLFEVMAKPNGWERQVQQQLRSNRELSDLSRWRVRFWECLLQRHPEKKVIMYCSTGYRSAMGVMALQLGAATSPLDFHPASTVGKQLANPCRRHEIADAS